MISKHLFHLFRTLLTRVVSSLSTWANGANDVANSYGTSVASGSLTLMQAGFLSAITETVGGSTVPNDVSGTFADSIGSLALGAGVTGTIRSGVFSVTPFINSPGVLILAMVCAEFGAGVFVAIATKFGFPVSTTHSIVGALVGVGIAANLHVNWEWKKSSYALLHLISTSEITWSYHQRSGSRR